ncbi:hypothetical protein BOX15_Mlig007376g2 [Macrostomum lignano]|uniref:UspA domain-containing protein n=1 Tax=Macrostomum lignano TaxID=282301 RepID=A0A267FG67_9PLAT|nr:hypothetical protein BOX15_Mlig007376g2 [Macrostomum lignano]
MTRRILIAVDGSDHSHRAVAFYADNMNKSSDVLIFTYAIEPPALPRGTGASLMANSEVYANMMKDAMKAGSQIGKAVRERCRQLGVNNETKFVERVTNNPGQSIVEVAKEENVSIIIMGNRGMGTLRRTFLGSVSDYVLHHAHRPVLIIPPEKPASRKSSVDNRKSSADARKASTDKKPTGAGV